MPGLLLVTRAMPGLVCGWLHVMSHIFWDIWNSSLNTNTSLLRNLEKSWQRCIIMYFFNCWLACCSFKCWSGLSASLLERGSLQQTLSYCCPSWIPCWLRTCPRISGPVRVLEWEVCTKDVIWCHMSGKPAKCLGEILWNGLCFCVYLPLYSKSSLASRTTTGYCFGRLQLTVTYNSTVSRFELLLRLYSGRRMTLSKSFLATCRKINPLKPTLLIIHPHSVPSVTKSYEMALQWHGSKVWARTPIQSRLASLYQIWSKHS